MTALKKILPLIALSACLLFAGCSSDPSKRHLEAGFTAVATFELSGGVLTTNSTDVEGSIKYAYKPDSLIVDPTTIAGYRIKRDGYDFGGWFRDEAYAEAWNFETDRIGESPVTLYAKWEKSIRYTYTLCYTDETGASVELYAYSVEAGEGFRDRLGKADGRKGYTALGFYEDAALSRPWPADFVHPGGETDADVKVYVKYAEGLWTLVSDFSELQTAFNYGANIYLTGNVDGGGSKLSLYKRYAGVFEGNGFTVSNFVKESSEGSLFGRLSLFGDLGGKAEIRNVRFTGVRFVTAAVSYRECKVAALAMTAPAGCRVTNVSVEGTFTVSEGTVFPEGVSPDLSRLNEAFYEAEGVEITGFTSSITAEL